MIEIENATAALAEAEINERHAALIRQIIAVVAIIGAMLLWVGLHH
jgi:hypothetical protein